MLNHLYALSIKVMTCSLPGLWFSVRSEAQRLNYLEFLSKGQFAGPSADPPAHPEGGPRNLCRLSPLGDPLAPCEM